MIGVRSTLIGSILLLGCRNAPAPILQQASAGTAQQDAREFSCNPATLRRWKELETAGALYELSEQVRDLGDCVGAERQRLLIEATLGIGALDVAERALQQSRRLIDVDTRTQLERRLEQLLSTRSKPSDPAAAQNHLARARRLLSARDCQGAAREAELAHNTKSPNDEASSVLGLAESCLGHTSAARRAFGRAAFEIGPGLKWVARYYLDGRAHWTWGADQKHLCAAAASGGKAEYLQLAGPDAADGRPFGEPYAIVPTKKDCRPTVSEPSASHDQSASESITVIHGAKHELEAWNQQEGRLLWAVDLPGRLIYAQPWIAGRRYVTAMVARHRGDVDGLGGAVLDLHTGKLLRQLKPAKEGSSKIVERIEKDQQYFIRAIDEPAVEALDLGTGRQLSRISQAAIRPYCGERKVFEGWTERDTMLLRCDGNLVELDLRSSTVRNSASLPSCKVAPVQIVGGWLARNHHFMLLLKCPLATTSSILDIETGANVVLETLGPDPRFVISPDRALLGATDGTPNGAWAITVMSVDTGRILSKTAFDEPITKERKTWLAAKSDVRQLLFCDDNGDATAITWTPSLAGGIQSNARELCAAQKNYPWARLQMPRQGVTISSDKSPSKSVRLLAKSSHYIQAIAPKSQRVIGHLVHLTRIGWVWILDADPNTLQTAGIPNEHSQWASGYTQTVQPSNLDWFWCVAGSRVVPNEVCREALLRDDVFQRILDRAE